MPGYKARKARARGQGSGPPPPSPDSSHQDAPSTSMETSPAPRTVSPWRPSSPIAFKPKREWALRDFENRSFETLPRDFPPLPMPHLPFPLGFEVPPLDLPELVTSTTPEGQALSPNAPDAWMAPAAFEDPLHAEGLEEISMDSAFWSDEQINEILGDSLSPLPREALVTPQALRDYQQEDLPDSPAPSLLDRDLNQDMVQYLEPSLPDLEMLPLPMDHEFVVPLPPAFQDTVESAPLSLDQPETESLMPAGWPSVRKRPAFTRPGTPFPLPPAKRRKLNSPNQHHHHDHVCTFEPSSPNFEPSSPNFEPISPPPQPDDDVLTPFDSELLAVAAATVAFITPVAQPSPCHSPPSLAPGTPWSRASPPPMISLPPLHLPPPSLLDLPPTSVILMRLQEQHLELKQQQASLAEKLAAVHNEIQKKKPRKTKSRAVNTLPITNDVCPVILHPMKHMRPTPAEHYQARLLQPFPRMLIEVHQVAPHRLMVNQAQMGEALTFLGQWARLSDFCFSHAINTFPWEFQVLLQPSSFSSETICKAFDTILAPYGILRDSDELWEALDWPKERFVQAGFPLLPPLLRAVPGEGGWDRLLTFRYNNGMKFNQSMVYTFYLITCPFLARMLYLPLIPSGNSRTVDFSMKVLDTISHPGLGSVAATEEINAIKFLLTALTGMTLAKAHRPALFNSASNREGRLWFKSGWNPRELKAEIYKFKHTDQNVLSEEYFDRLFQGRSKHFWAQKLSRSGCQAQSLESAELRMFPNTNQPNE